MPAPCLAPLLVCVDLVGSTLNVGSMYWNLPFTRVKTLITLQQLRIGRSRRKTCRSKSLAEAVSGSNAGCGLKVVISTFFSNLITAIFILLESYCFYDLSRAQRACRRAR